MQPLVILGASTRAAAYSALRAGFKPWCADLYADLDLERTCPVVRLRRTLQSKGLLRLLGQAPSAPWMYTGGWENRPSLVQHCAEVSPLWGNDAAVLRKVRRPWEVAAALKTAGVPCPEVRRTRGPEMAKGRWLVKKLASTGGQGVADYLGESARIPWGKVYFQEYIAGHSCAATYVGDGQRAFLLGVTRQLVGESRFHAEPFHYGGSVGPLPLEEKVASAFARLGDVVTEEFGLRGLFGVDCVLRDGQPYPVEVNPRYTASVEVLEYATGVKALALHRDVFVKGTPKGSLHALQTSEVFKTSEVCVRRPPVVGKAILYAQDNLTLSADGPWTTSLDRPPSDLPDFADIPHPGEIIQRGQPILTLFARGSSVASCLDTLMERARDLDRWLFGR